MPNERIDFVLPWVDATDPDWQASKARHYAEILHPRESDHGIVRYRETGTLRYVLRGIERFCPWYGTIHLITQGHLPEWLNADHPKINIVTHTELYENSRHLPTFNSSSIEMNLPNLHEVSERFVYLNDDFLIVRPLQPERFFQKELPVDFLMHGWIPRNRLYQILRDDSAWVKSLNNNVRLINRLFRPENLDKSLLFSPEYDLSGKTANGMLRFFWRRYYFFRHWHHPQPYRMQTLREVRQHFHPEMMHCSANRFRSDDDLTQYLYRYYHLAKGEFVPRWYNDGYHADLRSEKDFRRLENVLGSSRFNFVALYDNFDRKIEVKMRERLQEILERSFSKKASFER